MVALKKKKKKVLFFLTSGPKPKDIQFIIIEEHENQKHIHF